MSLLRFAKRPLRWGSRILLGALAILVLFNMWVVLRSSGRVSSNIASVTPAPVALVLGTSKTLASGGVNIFWRGRMDAAAELYKAGKVRKILVSGDNRSKDYNEPRDMRNALVERGVPASVITLDLAGLRTLDSVIRAHEIYGIDECVIVSDDFHLPRSLWLADRRGLKATGFHGPSLPWEISGKSRGREWLARIKAALDEWVLGTEARHYGDPETLSGQKPAPRGKLPGVTNP